MYKNKWDFIISSILFIRSTCIKYLNKRITSSKQQIIPSNKKIECKIKKRIYQRARISAANRSEWPRPTERIKKKRFEFESFAQCFFVPFSPNFQSNGYNFTGLGKTILLRTTQIIHLPIVWFGLFLMAHPTYLIFMNQNYECFVCKLNNVFWI